MVTFLAVFLMIAAGLFSQENIITAVSVSGLKRTKSYIIKRPLQKFIGRDAESIDINEVIAILQSATIVEPLAVEIENNQEGNGKTLAVTVREKWSVFPIPFFSINSSGWGIGGAFMDTNAFGIKDNMMLMGSYGTNGWMANIMYIHSPASVGSFGWNLMGMFLFQDKESVDQKDEEILRRFNSMTINPSIGLSYKLTDLITPSISVGYKNVMLRDTDSPVNAPENGVQAMSITPGIGILHNTWDGYFLNEKSASLKYNYTFIFSAKEGCSILCVCGN
jgi:outer membrane protein assembly factor BamA